jgi:hypothetical protein
MNKNMLLLLVALGVGYWLYKKNKKASTGANTTTAPATVSGTEAQVSAMIAADSAVAG